MFWGKGAGESAGIPFFRSDSSGRTEKKRDFADKAASPIVTTKGNSGTFWIYEILRKKSSKSKN